MDFRNCLEPNNLTIYAANFVGGVKDTAYAICATVLNTITIPAAGGEQNVRWELSQQRLLQNITLSPNFEVFTLSQAGTYLINYNSNVALSDAGSQALVQLVVNGTVVCFNILFASGSPMEGVLTNTYPIVVSEGTPVTVAFSVKYQFGTTNAAEFRYDQCSIVKID